MKLKQTNIVVVLLTFTTLSLFAAEQPAPAETSPKPALDAEPAAEEAVSRTGVVTRVRDASLGLTIKGNQELPNVLYIVPWKKGLKNDISPIQGRIVEEVYGPVELNVFKRRVELFRAFNPVVLTTSQTTTTPE